MLDRTLTHSSSCPTGQKEENTNNLFCCWFCSHCRHHLSVRHRTIQSHCMVQVPKAPGQARNAQQRKAAPAAQPGPSSLPGTA